MRITTFMIYNQFAESLSNNLSNLSKVQQQLATGKKMTKPSDDVIALRGSMAYKVSISNIEQFNRNIEEGISLLGLTESSLSSATNILNRVRELAVSESSDTSTSDTREITSYEIRNLFNQMLDIGNSKLRNKYIFSGYLTNTQTFDTNGNYGGDSNNIQIDIGEGIRSSINVTGDTAFFDNNRLSTTDLTGQTLSGNLTITPGGGTAYSMNAADVFAGASPEEIRDTINAPMSAAYDSTVPETIGTGNLILKAGSGDPVELAVDATNNTPELLRDAVNGLSMGVTAGIFEDASGNQRLFFRPTTPGDSISIDVEDDDLNNIDTSGLSAMLHTDLKSNLTENALGVQALILNDGTEERLVLEPIPSGGTFTVAVTDTDGNNTDNTGLSMLHHTDATDTNLGNSISFFTMLDHFANALETNDREGIEASMFFMDGAIDSIVNTTADVGARLKYVTDQQDRLEDTVLSYQESLSVLEDADIAAVAMEMTKIQTTLESMRISSVESLSQSLFDFLR